MDLVTGALGSVTPKLALLLTEYNLQMGLRKEIIRLSREVESVHAALCKVAEVPPEQRTLQVECWARQALDLSYDLEDILDPFLVRVEGHDPSRLQRAKMKMRNLFRKAKTDRDIDIADAVKGISERFRELTMRRKRYNIDDDMAMSSAMTLTIDPRLATLYMETTVVVGMEEARDELISMLSSEDHESNEKTKIVSVVGLGGLGKTTLVKVVYDALEREFDYRVFVSIGQHPDLKLVFRAILIGLYQDKYLDSPITIRGERQLIHEIREFLQDKRYLIVIDDIWRRESWEKIKLALSENNNGSIIIATTRNMVVAEEIGVVYKLEPLSYDRSKKLFYDRIFGGKGDNNIDNQLNEVSDKILKKCGGIPLAIITMASQLVDKPREEWFNVLSTIDFGNKGSGHMENIMRIFSLSYYDLPLHLRTCLLYLSAFPEDHVIKKDTLIWKWIGEGFIQKEQGKCLFEIGEIYFNDLINRSMIQAAEIEFDGVIKGCRVHDMVLDLIRSLSYKEEFVFVLDEDHEKGPPGGVRRLALHNINGEHSLDDNVGLGQLRSVNAIGCPTYMLGHSRFSVLRVLSLENCESREGYHFEHVGKLLQLRFLGLRNTLVGKLPEEMGRLKFLQTLMLEGSGVEELPESMRQLTELMCLSADWKTRVPHWIGNLTSLQQLEIYPGGGDDEYSTRWFVKELGNLTQLRVLRFIMKVQEEEQIRDLLESLSNLREVRVIHFDYYGAQVNNAAVLEPAGFVLSKQLYSIELRWMEFSRLPVWINRHHLPNLRHLWLMLSDVDKQDLKTLGEFPLLFCLHLVLVNTGQGKIIAIGNDGAFQRLKFCSITKPLQFQQEAMPKLEVLEFHFNVRLLRDANHDFNFDFGFENLSSLQKVIIEGNSSAAFSEEMEEADAALRHAINIHPKRPTFEINWFGQKIKTKDVAPRQLCGSLAEIADEESGVEVSSTEEKNDQLLTDSNN